MIASMEAMMLIPSNITHKLPPKKSKKQSSGRQGGWSTTVMYTSQDIFVLSINSEGIIYLPISALLVLKEERRAIECCQFDKSKVIVSV